MMRALFSQKERRGARVVHAQRLLMSGISEGVPPSKKKMAAAKEEEEKAVDIWQDCLQSFDIATAAKPDGEAGEAAEEASNEPYNLLVFGAPLRAHAGGRLGIPSTPGLFLGACPTIP